MPPSAFAIKGDLNNDLRVDSRDITSLIGYLLGEDSLTTQGLANADYNEDTFIDVADLVNLVDQTNMTKLTSASPSDGESGVAVTRETILRFSAPLDSSTINGTNVAARFSGQRLDARLQVSPDRRRITMFYEDPLPPSARVSIEIDERSLLDDQGKSVDVDGDGVASGFVEALQFDTLTLTVIEGTAVCGRVFASQLRTSDAGTSVNLPLRGVRITVDGRENELNAVTDEMGNFRLEPAPAGRFFVHIDGRQVSTAIIDGATTTTRFPEGPYYPFVGKPFESKAGLEVNMLNIYLPLVEGRPRFLPELDFQRQYSRNP